MDPCASEDGDIRASLFAASPQLQAADMRTFLPPTKFSLMKRIDGFQAPSPFPRALTILSSSPTADDDAKGAARNHTDGASATATPHHGTFVKTSAYASLVSSLAHKVGRALDDAPAQAANVYNVTGPGYQHVIALRAANLNVGLPWEELKTSLRRAGADFAAEITSLVERFWLPYAASALYSGRDPLATRVTISRNVHVPLERFRTRATLWHWDGLSDRGIKLLVYLTDVPDNRSGCMLVMRHAKTRGAWRMARKALFGGDMRPPSVPQPWMLQLLEKGYLPHCITGPAGTLTYFDTNIVHRGSRPAAGKKRDFVLIELTPPPAAPTAATLATPASNPPISKPSATNVVEAASPQATPRRALAPRAAAVDTTAALHAPVGPSAAMAVAVRGEKSHRKMPMLGFGTANRRSAIGAPLVKSLVAFLTNGGRLIDTAQMYGNYREIGSAIKKAKVPREEVWLVTKVNTLPTRGGVNSTSGVKHAIDEALQKLQTAHLDVALIHMPWGNSPEVLLTIWRGLIACQGSGHCKTIGVSNFNREQIEELAKATGVWPAVNELEYHPYVSSQTKELVRWCLEKRIVVIAYGSLGGSANKGSSGGSVAEVARAHGSSTARVLLRWAMQQGVVVIPGATSTAHITENLALLSQPPALSLSDAEMRAIGSTAVTPPRSFKLWRGLCKEDAPGSNRGCTPSV